MQPAKIRTSKAILFIASLGVIFAATAVQAERNFLDDANTRSAGPGSATPLGGHEFPRVFNHEFIGNISNQAAGRYMFLDAHGTQFGNMATVKNVYSPETKLIRHISGRAYQQYSSGYCDISGGPAFESTTNSSQGGPSSAGCGIYAGHWLYEAGTTLRQTVNASANVLPVQDASRFSVNEYVVIYNSPAGSFNNAEHAKITSTNNGAKTITVQRGYKSTKSSHNSGSIVAQHVLGQGTEKRLWAFNMSTVSPTDASGKRFWQFYADWMGNNYNRHNSGAVAGANIAGIVLDADFYIDLTSKNADHNNDLNTDHGISGSGVNWLGEGLDSFYARVRTRLPNKYVMVGVHDARGFESAQGAQMENWLDYGNGDYNPKPIYKKLDELFQTYLFNMSDRDQGPTLVHNLTKTPTKQYPGSSSPKPTSNAPFRLGLALTLMEDGYYGTHTAMSTDAWWDEYAVNLNKSSPNYGKAVSKNDYAGVATHRGWLGQPLGKFKRVYNDADFAPASSVLNNGSFDTNTQGWSGSNVNLTRVSSGTQDGPGAVRASRMNSYNKSITGASMRSNAISTTNGATYTLAFSARSDEHREIRIDFAGDIDKVPLGPQWRRYVVELKANGGSSTLRFNLGRENTQVWFDSIYMFKNKSAHVFKREFENGMALANASTSSKTINVGNGWRRISGTQDSGINNGNAVSSVTIGPRDGLILIRDGAASGGGGGGGGSGGASLGDLVWRDTDNDGIQDGNESGYSGVNVSLSQCSGGVLESTVTDSNGNYSFSNLAAGSYIVDFERPTGATSSPYRAGSDWGIDSDADAATGETLCVTLNANQSKSGVDAGFKPPAGGGGGGSGSAELGDLVWRDSNSDGLQGGNETGYAGVTVSLKSCSGNVLQTTATDSNGNYAFSNLAAGSYIVGFQKPTGATASPNRVGSDWGIDSDANVNTGDTLCVTLNANQTKSGVDAGFKPPAGGGGGSGSASIGNFVWRDSDGDGIQDGNESGYAGVTVFLNSCSGNTLASTATGPDGGYTFSNLAAGNYQVEFESPSGATGSPFRAGNDRGVDSDADADTGATLCISLAANESKGGVDAGFIPPTGGGGGSGNASIGDLVWRDTDSDGIQDGNESGYAGVNVSLTSCSGNVLASTVTDNSGNYEFANIAAGNYVVEFAKPNNASASPFRAGNDFGADSDANENTGASLCLNLSANESKAGVDAGFVPPTGGGSGNANIGDLVWRDTDGDGIQDGNESGFSGVSVSLNSCSGNTLASTVTDSNGNYAFSNIAAGSYVVSFQRPNNTTTSPFRAGNDFGADSDADAATGDSLCVNLSANESKSGVDAGFIPQSSTVSGANIGDYVWWDENSNGLQDGNEGGVVGVVVQLRWCGNGLADTTTTDSNGGYTFDDLSPGNYKIQVVAPNGATFSPTRRGSDFTTDSNAESDGVTTCISIGQDSSRPHTDVGLIF